MAALMPEVADAGENHGEAEAVCRGDDFRIADGAARLNDDAGARTISESSKKVPKSHEPLPGNTRPCKSGGRLTSRAHFTTSSQLASGAMIKSVR
jgi:hypothetical protein